jgi:hypothetical protein
MLVPSEGRVGGEEYLYGIMVPQKNCGIVVKMALFVVNTLSEFQPHPSL